MFLIWAVLRANALKDSFQYSPEGIVKSLYMNFPAVVLYLGKVIFPFNLSVLPTLQDSTLLWGFLSLGLILIVLIFSKSKKMGYIVFGVCWFLALLLPSFIRINTEYVADFIEHRIYLPLVGLIVIFSEVDFIKNLNFSKKIILFFCGLYLVLLSVISIIHSSNFENGIKYWQNAVTNSPHHPLAHKNLGVMYYMNENYPLAIAEYEKSLDINPRETMVHNNLGVIYMYNKDFKKAEEEYKKELAINPYYDNAVFNYGLLYYLQGKNKEAEDWWLMTIKVNPEYVNAYRSLAILYQSLGNTDKANYYYQEALKRGATF
jgi:Tfp pilus assembly protein PilF